MEWLRDLFTPRETATPSSSVVSVARQGYRCGRNLYRPGADRAVAVGRLVDHQVELRASLHPGAPYDPHQARTFCWAVLNGFDDAERAARESS